MIALRITPEMLARIEQWREKANATAPNPYNQADAIRALITAGLDAANDNGGRR